MGGSVHPRALSQEERSKLGKDMREKHNALSSTKDNLNAYFHEALRLLHDEPFDVSAFPNIMGQHTFISNTRQSQARALLINHMTLMNYMNVLPMRTGLKAHSNVKSGTKIKMTYPMTEFERWKIFAYLGRKGVVFRANLL